MRGISEFFLRYIAICCRTGKFDNGRVCIGTGPRLETAQDLMLRLKNLLAFQGQDPDYSHSRSTSTEVKINGVTVTAFPSYNSSSLRGYTNVRFLMFDEVAWWPAFQASEIMGVITGYVSKPNSDPHVILSLLPTNLRH